MFFLSTAKAASWAVSELQQGSELRITRDETPPPHTLKSDVGRSAPLPAPRALLRGGQAGLATVSPEVWAPCVSVSERGPHVRTGATGAWCQYD